jgi:hypothetical protein
MNLICMKEKRISSIISIYLHLIMKKKQMKQIEKNNKEKTTDTKTNLIQ